MRQRNRNHAIPAALRAGRTRRAVATAAMIGLLNASTALASENPVSWLATVATESDYNAHDQIVSLTTTYAGGAGLSLATSYIEHFADPLAPPDEVQREEAFWGAAIKTDSGGLLGNVTTEVGYGGIAANSGDGFGDSDHQFVQFDTRAQTEYVEYGTHFQSAGSSFYRPGSDIATDRELAEIWVARAWNNIRLRSFVNQSYDNVNKAPERARLTDTRVGTRVEYTFASVPQLSSRLDYSSGTRRSSLDPLDADRIDATTSLTRASVNYKRDRWSSTAFASYATQDDAGGLTNQSYQQLARQWSGAIRVSRRLSVHPGVYSSVTTLDDAQEYGQQRRWLNLRYQPRRNRIQLATYLSQLHQDDGVSSYDELRQGVEFNARWRLFGSDLVARASYDHYRRRTDGVGTRDDGMNVWLGWHKQLAGYSPAKSAARADS